MVVNFSIGLLLVVIAVLMFGFAFGTVLFDVSNAKLYPELMALGGLFGFLGIKLP